MLERGTLPDQRVVTGTLGTIAGAAESAGVRAPALVVVGEVVALHERLAWLDRGAPAGRGDGRGDPGAGPGQRAGGSRLRGSGCEVVEAPAIKIVPLDGPAPDVSAYDLVCLTSPNGVRLLFYASGGGWSRCAGAGRQRGWRRSVRARLAPCPSAA